MKIPLLSPTSKDEHMAASGADFRPFQAWRYNSQKTLIGEVIAPPYDVISQDEQNRLYERSPYNCIRLILNKIEPADDDFSNRYTRAKQCFQEWKEEGVLVKEAEPAFYLYRQTFEHPVTGETSQRIALLGKIKLEPFDKGIVVPHEKTLSKPRADRRKLLETTQTNFSPVFGLYEHPHNQKNVIEEKILTKRPLYEAMDDQGVQHSLWPITDSQICGEISKSMRKQKIYIADGHHRYQTALEFAQERRLALKTPEGQELDSDFLYIALVEFHDAGLVLLPTHRLIQPMPDWNEAGALKALEPYFQIKPMPLEALKQQLNQPQSKKTQFGLYFRSKASYLITLNDSASAKRRMPSGKSDIWYNLDVALISHFVLGSLWEIPESEWERVIRYTHSTPEAVDLVETGEIPAAFLLHAPSVELLRDMGKTGELLPQKSTYFYPKLASGLLFHQHEK